MPPTPGSIHRRPRHDSGAARIWAWARRQRRTWTAHEAAAACAVASRRARAIVAAMAAAGLLEQTAEVARGEGGQLTPAGWRLSAAGRALPVPPVLIIDGETGSIVGVRVYDGSGNAELRRLIEETGLSTRAAARALRLNSRTLRRILSGETPISRDDPVLTRAMPSRR